MRMERYSEYKDSKDAYLDSVPVHWEELRLKQTGSSRNGLTYSPMDVCENGEPGTLVLRSSNIQNGKLTLVDNVYVKCPIREELYVKKGDILVCSRNGSRDLVGKLVLIDSDIVASFGAFMMIYRTNLWNRFMAYAVDISIKRYKSLFSTSTINQLVKNDFNNFIVQIPPLSEQHSIVSYLDTKCSMIETLLSNKEKEISLLQEMKQRIIADAVTRGLNPNVKFKSTDIPWLPEIPEHWEMSKVSSHFKQRNEKVSDKDYRPLSVSKIGVTPQLDNVALSNAEGNSRKLVKVGDYAVNSRSDRKGSCGISSYEGSVSLITIVLEPFDIDGNYVHYLFRSNPWVEEFYRYGRGIVADLWTTNYQMMKGMYLPVPPLSEQQAIVSYITERTAKLDSLIGNLNKEIECIKEYKQRLISDVVTGQIKVS